MAETQVDYTNLPPGWDCRYDHQSQRYYFVNHFTKTTSWEDPRGRYKQLLDGVPPHVTEHIPMQPMHGSPYHVYPAKNYPQAQAAFQGPSSTLPSLSASPQLVAKLQQLEMSPVSIPNTPRSTNANVQETSFSNGTANIDTDATVTKINTMFPTANDTHIRLLLKKYYNREAVVISALQVEKHPLTTPGPYATPPPPGRHFYNPATQQYHATPPLGREVLTSSRNESPIPYRPASGASGSYGSPRFGEGFRSSPKPHSSPKMKLRYLKGIFPKAGEILILDLLANADNNVQKASEKLIEMGFEKKDTNIQKLSIKKKEEEKARKLEIEKIQAQQPPRIKTDEEKNKMKVRLQNQYKTVAEKIISMALESVDYSEEKACQILNIVMQEDDTSKVQGNSQLKNESIRITSDGVDAATQAQSRSSSCRSTSSKVVRILQTQESNINDTTVTYDETSTTLFDYNHTKDIEYISPSNGNRLKQNLLKAKNDHAKITPETDDGNTTDFNTILHRMPTSGPNPGLSKGPNDDLLLVDYVSWRGANSDLVLGRKGLACGPDKTNRTDRNYTPRGSSSQYYNGPSAGLVKGSMYSQINRGMADVKVN